MKKTITYYLKNSLTFRLFFTLTGVIVLALLLVAGLGLRSSNSEITDDYDAQLMTESIVIWQLTHENIHPDAQEQFGIDDHIPWIQPVSQEMVLEYAKWRGYRIWKDDKIVVESDNIEDFPKIASPKGFSEFKVGTEIWRAYALHVPEDHMIVETFENLRNRRILQDDILTGIIYPSLAILPLLALLLYFGIRYGLRNLYTLAKMLETRTADDFTKLNEKDSSIELKPLIHSINQLFNKLELSVSYERKFVDHAAHELRTPLAALKLQAQLIAKSLPQTADKEPIEELLAGVNRAARLVDQLLQLSRLPHQEIDYANIELFLPLKEAISLQAIHALDRKITLELVRDDQLTVTSHFQLLVSLISIFLENAIKYTPEGGRVTLAILRDNGWPCIRIMDTGPGIPEHERSRVFERFYRMDETDQPGSGLGLAIASQIADLLSIKIHLDATADGQSGLGVSLIFVGMR